MATAPTNEQKTADKAKKPYTPPRLQEWGSMTDITRAVGNAGGPDGGKSGHRSRTNP